MGAEDVNKHPDLSHLLEDLTHRIASTGIHKTTQAELTQASHAMKHARLKYLEEETFHRLIQDVVYQTPKSRSEEKAFKEVGDALTLSEVRSHVELLGGTNENSSDELCQDSSSKPSKRQFLFGITPEKILDCAEIQPTEKCIKEVLHNVEEQLNGDWTKIASFHDPVGFMSYDPDEIIKIPKQLEAVRQTTIVEKKKLVHSITQTDYLFTKVQAHLLEYGNYLKSLMAKQRLCHYPAKHMATLSMQFSALLHKVRSVELQILLDTYTSSTVPALKFLHSHIRERASKAESSVVRLKHELSSFDALDSRFKALLLEYAKIQSDIIVCKSSDGKI